MIMYVPKLQLHSIDHAAHMSDFFFFFLRHKTVTAHNDLTDKLDQIHKCIGLDRRIPTLPQACDAISQLSVKVLVSQISAQLSYTCSSSPLS